MEDGLWEEADARQSSVYEKTPRILAKNIPRQPSLYNSMYGQASIATRNECGSAAAPTKRSPAEPTHIVDDSAIPPLVAVSGRTDELPLSVENTYNPLLPLPADSDRQMSDSVSAFVNYDPCELYSMSDPPFLPPDINTVGVHRTKAPLKPESHLSQLLMLASLRRALILHYFAQLDSDDHACSRIQAIVSDELPLPHSLALRSISQQLHTSMEGKYSKFRNFYMNMLRACMFVVESLEKRYNLVSGSAALSDEHSLSTGTSKTHQGRSRKGSIIQTSEMTSIRHAVSATDPTHCSPVDAGANIQTVPESSLTASAHTTEPLPSRPLLGITSSDHCEQPPLKLTGSKTYRQTVIKASKVQGSLNIPCVEHVRKSDTLFSVCDDYSGFSASQIRFFLHSVFAAEALFLRAKTSYKYTILLAKKDSWLPLLNIIREQMHLLRYKELDERIPVPGYEVLVYIIQL